MTDPTIANHDQHEFWNDIKGALWVDLQPRIDALLAPFGDKALEKLAAQAGERILEIGCGTGTTTLSLAEQVGPSGEVLAADLSEPMLNLAISRTSEQPEHRVTCVEADAQVYPFPSNHFNAAFSRFGVMFFEDPVAAFANIYRAVCPGGRLAYVCWADRLDNPWVRIPTGAAKAFLELPAPPADDEPGQFSMEKSDRIQQILDAAGWSDIAMQRFDLDWCLGSDASDAASFISNMGPMSEPFALADSNTQRKTLQVIEQALVPYADSRGVFLGFSTWIVSATRA